MQWLINLSFHLLEIMLDVWIYLIWDWVFCIVWYGSLLYFDETLSICVFLLLLLLYCNRIYSVGVSIFNLVSLAICWNILKLFVGASCWRGNCCACNIIFGDMFTMLGGWFHRCLCMVLDFRWWCRVVYFGHLLPVEIFIFLTFCFYALFIILLFVSMMEISWKLFLNIVELWVWFRSYVG